MVSKVPPEKPPSGFKSRTLPIETFFAGSQLLRIHQSIHGALYFGRSGDYRFDSPNGTYGVCYTGMTAEACFVETCLTQVGATLVSATFLDARELSFIDVKEDLSLVMLHGTGLAPMGATSIVSAGPYDISQAWAEAIHDHPGNHDGIIYRTSHDDDEFGVAIFERSKHKVNQGSGIGLMKDARTIASLLNRYGVGLT